MQVTPPNKSQPTPGSGSSSAARFTPWPGAADLWSLAASQLMKTSKRLRREGAQRRPATFTCLLRCHAFGWCLARLPPYLESTANGFADTPRLCSQTERPYLGRRVTECALA